MSNADNDCFTQCLFELEQGNVITTGWIPTWAAKKGNRVQLVEYGEDFWIVRDVYLTVSGAEVRENERHYKLMQGSLKGGGIDEKKA